MTQEDIIDRVVQLYNIDNGLRPLYHDEAEELIRLEALIEDEDEEA